MTQLKPWRPSEGGAEAIPLCLNLGGGEAGAGVTSLPPRRGAAV